MADGDGDGIRSLRRADPPPGQAVLAETLLQRSGKGAQEGYL